MITVEDVTKKLKEDDDLYDEKDAYILGYSPRILDSAYQVILYPCMLASLSTIISYIIGLLDHGLLDI